MRNVGILPDDYNGTAQQLFDYFMEHGRPGILDEGSLVFYGKSYKEIKHVDFAVSRYQVVGAMGGDKTTTTIEEAKRRNASVKMRHWKYRKDFIIAIKPFYEKIGML